MLPDFGIYRDAETKIFFAKAKCLLSGIAQGAGSVYGRGVVKIGDDAVGNMSEFGGRGEIGWVNGEKELRQAGFMEGVER